MLGGQGRVLRFLHLAGRTKNSASPRPDNLVLMKAVAVVVVVVVVVLLVVVVVWAI